MGRKIVFLVLVLLGAVFISGCTGPLDEGTQAVMESTDAWLRGEQGSARFPGGVAGEPIGVWKEGKTFYWMATIKNQDGLHIGNLIVTQKNFISPGQIVSYSEPMEKILNYTGEEAYQLMIIKNPDYPAYQIEKPILISVGGEGLYWYSEVKVNNEVLDELYISTFTLF